MDKLTLQSPKTRMAIVAIICWIFASWVWYPGFILGDPFNQYMQAAGYTYISDWHPAIMARFWQLEIFLFHSPFLLASTWSGILSIAIYIFVLPKADVWGIKAYLALFFCPLFFGMMGLVDKDIPLANTIFLACAVIVFLGVKPQCKGREWLVFLVSCLLVLVTFLRFNAAFITAPLLVGLLCGWKHRIRNLLGMLIVVLVFLGISPLINKYVFRAVQEYPETSLELFDVAGIASKGLKISSLERDQIMSSWKEADQAHKLVACYNPQRWDSFGAYQLPQYRHFQVGWDNWANDWNIRIPMPSKKSWANLCQDFGDEMRQNPKALKVTWIKSIKSHPLSYMSHRFDYFRRSVMGYLRSSYQRNDPGFYPWPQLEKPNQRFNYVEYAYRYPMYLIRRAPWNYGVTWFLLDIVIFIMTLKKRKKWEELANGFSFAAIMYIAGYFFVGVGRLYRYILPSVYLTIAILLVYLIRSSLNYITVKNK